MNLVVSILGFSILAIAAWKTVEWLVDPEPPPFPRNYPFDDYEPLSTVPKPPSPEERMADAQERAANALEKMASREES